MEQIVGVAQLYFMPHPLLEIVERLMAHPIFKAEKIQEESLDSNLPDLIPSPSPSVKNVLHLRLKQTFSPKI